VDNNLVLEEGKLYIMSGIPGAGKSTLLKQVDQSMIVSTDMIRGMLSSTFPQSLTDAFELKTRVSECMGGTAFAVAEMIVKEKLKEGLTTFIDATSTNDEDRGFWANIAKKCGTEAIVLILDTPLEECIDQDSKRKLFVGERVINIFNNRFEKTSQFKHIVINKNTKFTFDSPNVIDDNVKIDAVGDIHGLYDELVQILEMAGYDLSTGVPVHKDGRKLLFLGDVIDRGEKSVEVWNLIVKSVRAGHLMVVGNHELKLAKNIGLFLKGEEMTGGYAAVKTVTQFIKGNVNLNEALHFIESLPSYLIHKNKVFVHAKISNFSRGLTPISEMVYGTNPKDDRDMDELYDSLYKAGYNKYKLIRGHIPQKFISDHVFSLDDEQAFGGDLMLLNTDNVNNRSEFESTVLKVRSQFNFDLLMEENKNSLNTVLEVLVNKKFATKKMSPDGTLKLFKYSTKVFYDNLWAAGGEALLKARGIVLDVTGEIIQHPFDKVFNYKENDTGLDIPDKEIIRYVEKVNGFLGNISLNPYTKDLLITTTGSFDSDFIKYVKDLISPRQNGMIKRFLSNNNVTLSFEVVHEEDPHIIKYDTFELHLIGVRGKNIDDITWDESIMDEVAKELGFTRPAHGFASFEDVKNMAKNTKIEGYMVQRLINEKWVTVLKFKSPHYLTTKFIGRMSEANIKFMFSNPEKFKSGLDEEFFPLVDMILNSIGKEDFSAMESVDRISLIQSLTIQLQS
jgi:predicted kinase